MRSVGAYFLDSRYPTRSRFGEEVLPDTDEYLQNWMENMSVVIWHPASSCKMGPPNDPDSVVDPQLR